MDPLYRLLDSRLLRRTRRVTAEGALPPDRRQPLEAGGGNLFVFFNLESAFAMGHAILGVAPPDGPVSTFSFFRKARRIAARARVATIREDLTFREIIDRGGWILHGTDDDAWLEHMTCCLALQCPRERCEQARAYFKAIARDPGIYRLLTRNCIHICRLALAAGGVRMLGRRGHPFRTMLPRRVYLHAAKARGASPFQAWRYWFPAVEPPADLAARYRVRPVKIPSLITPLDE